jgi:glycosyltransferase involved in cell wall biosynthesis
VKVLILLNEGGVSGGHVIQATRTAESLRAIGVDVTLSHDSDDLSGYRIVHGFGLSPPILRRARESGGVAVVSPIWWSADYRAGVTRPRTTSHRIEQAARLAFSAARRGAHETARRLRQHIEEAARSFESADLLLPNSQLEAAQIQTDLGISTPMRIVPNAFDPDFFTPPEPGTPRSGVACVGRIEPHKNQLGLIEALRGTGISLIVAGPEHPHHTDYARRCHACADSSVSFLPGGDQLFVRDVLRSAAVHTLPSWFETTGLVSLEAAGTGCAIVTTERGYAREYFGGYATYCDPASQSSIRDAVQSALATGPPAALRNHVASRFTWTQTARATLAAYEWILDPRRRGPEPLQG